MIRTPVGDTNESKKPDVNKQLQDIIHSIQKSFKISDSMIQTVNTTSKCLDDVIPTGNIAVDRALGGGFPKGRMMELYGPESAGKTTLALHLIASAQKQGEICAFIDAEYTFDSQYAGSLGIDLDRLIVVQPEAGEQALAITAALVEKGVNVIVVDSVAALTPKAVLEGDYDKKFMGVQAAMMSQGLNKLNRTMAQHKSTIVFVNQIREKIGVLYGDPTTTPGGRALKFYASVRIEVKMGQRLKNKEEALGHITRIKTTKNKTYPPFKLALVNMYYGKGLDRIGPLIDAAIDLGLIEQRAASYTMVWATENQGLFDNPVLQKIRGREAVEEELRSWPPSVIDALESEIRKTIFTIDATDINTTANELVDEDTGEVLEPDASEDN